MPGPKRSRTRSAFGFQKPDDDASYDNMKLRVQERIEKVFRPEFLNRVDDVIVFRHLNVEDLKRSHRPGTEQGPRTPGRARPEAAVDRRGQEVPDQEGSNTDFGARPLRRAIENFVEDPLSEELLKGEFQGKDTITIAVKEVGDEKQLVFRGSARPRPRRPRPPPSPRGTAPAAVPAARRPPRGERPRAGAKSRTDRGGSNGGGPSPARAAHPHVLPNAV